jgi:uncharacterized protein YbgA (DUF1722 family)/uncharacterized protein YbbK (DUF523 family)
MEKINIGISSCLIGEKVRFDGGHKNNKYIVDDLGEFFQYKAFCPEVSIGLGIPREPIRLVERDGETRCIGTKNSALDVTEKLISVAKQQHDWLSELSGYIVKKDSPSCGMARVKVYRGDMPDRDGIGLYTKTLLEQFPHLPVEEEGRLNDLPLRENFIGRVFVYSRWQQMLKAGLSMAAMQQFHASHKYLFMSHSPSDSKKLGALLANHEQLALETIAEQYLGQMMQLMKIHSSRKKHVNTLQHVQGYLKKHLDSTTKQSFHKALMDYKEGLVPLIVPISLLNSHFEKYPNDYIEKSYYLEPYPKALKLLNHL